MLFIFVFVFCLCFPIQLILGVKLITEITELKADLPKKNATDYRIIQKTENSVLITEYTEVNRCGFLVNRQNNRITGCILK